MKKQLFWIILGLTLLISPFTQASEKIIFSVSPERNVSELARLWIPVLNELKKSSGLNLQFDTAPNAKKFNKKLKSGKIDVGFIDPYAYSSLLTDQFNALAKPLSRDEENAPLGIIVVQEKSSFKTLDDLAGKSFTFSSAESFSSSVLPRFHMQATKMPYIASFSRSSISSVLAVSRGLHDAAGLEVSIYDSLPISLKKKLRIVWTSTPSDLCQGMKNHPFVFAINKNLPENTAEKLRSALLAMNNSAKGRNLIQSLGFNSIQIADNKDWTGFKPLAQRVLNE